MAPLFRRRFTPRRTFGHRKRRAMSWLGVSTGAGLLTPGSNAISTLLNHADVTALGMVNPTILRIHLNAVAALTTAVDQDEQAGLWVGIRLVDQLTLNNPAGVPTPFDWAASNDWMVHRAWYLAHNSQLATVADTRNAPLSVIREVIDGRSKRRLDADDALVVVFTNVPPSIGTASSLGCALTGRILIGDS